jgi:hypothetical protein
MEPDGSRGGCDLIGCGCACLLWLLLALLLFVGWITRPTP